MWVPSPLHKVLAWRSRVSRFPLWPVVMVVTWGFWFLSLWPQWLTIDERGIATSHLFMWGDWAAHFTYINHFRVEPFELWFARNPIFAAAHFVYPPLSSVLSAVLMRLGFSLHGATILPSMVLTVFFLHALWRWIKAHGLSDRATYFGASAFLLSGAWGYKKWITEAITKAFSGDFSVLGFPPEFVTKDFDNFIDWVNPIVSMMLPQRAFLLGFPIFLLILFLIHKQVFSSEAQKESSAGIDVGLLSFVLFLSHTHSFLALGFLSAFWCFAYPKKWRFWLSFALSTLLLVIPWYLAVLRSDVGTQAFSIRLGWMAPRPLTPWGWLQFWFLNWGFFLPLWCVGIVRVMRRSRRELLWSLPFFGIFVFANIVQTQRWEWDNTKFFTAALIGMIPVIVMGWQSLVALARKLPIGAKQGVIGLVLGTYILQIAPGFFDVLNLSQPSRTRWEIASPNDFVFAKHVEMYVPPGSIVLTGDLHNQPTSMLAGRTLLLGFKGWVWSYGLDYSGYDTAVEGMYRDITVSAELMRTHKIQFVVVGPHEYAQFGRNLVPETECNELARAGEVKLFDCLTWRES